MSGLAVILPQLAKTSRMTCESVSRSGLAIASRVAGSSTIWQDKLHAARGQNQRRDQNSPAQVTIAVGTKLLRCNEIP
jgi:hypothetical protein